MDKQERRQIERAAIDKFGNDNQIIKAIEEMGELTQALCKYLNSPDEVSEEVANSVMEELGDVTIMCEQLHMIFGSTAPWEHQKLIRLKERLK